jgi:hypothetical protein
VVIQRLAGVAWLEINDKRYGRKQNANHTKPHPASDEIGICTKSDTSNDWNEPGLPSPVDDIGKSQRTRDDTDEEVSHDEGFSEMCSSTEE